MTSRRPYAFPLMFAASLTLVACGQKTESDAPAADAAPSIAVPPAAPAAAPAPAAIQTQAGPAGMQVALVKAQVTGSVLTVQLSYSIGTDDFASDRFRAEEVAVIDDTTSQRYGVLRDATGRWTASPLESPTSDFVTASTHAGAPAVVWFKFPAPPPTSPTVSITIPGVGPFDGVTVQR
ncbi:hypothetical protein BH10PSE1_BH10PSE1_00070 [soil metagenome]